MFGRVEGRFFEPPLRWDILPDGTIAYSDSSAYAVKFVRPGGQVIDVVQRPIEPGGVSRRLRSAAIEREIGSRESLFEDSGGLPRDVREQIEDREFYPEIQIVRQLRATWEGGLWIRRPGEEPWDTGGPIDVFGPDRQYVGTFAAGITSIPVAFGPDGLVAYWEVYGSVVAWPLRVSLSVEGDRPGLLTRTLRALRLRSAPRVPAVSWTQNATRAAEPMALAVDIANLGTGYYTLKTLAAGAGGTRMSPAGTRSPGPGPPGPAAHPTLRYALTIRTVGVSLCPSWGAR